MIKAIFWDNDGILVDTKQYYYKATKEELATVGVDLSKELFVELPLKQAKGAWHLATEKGRSGAEVKELHRQRNTNYLEMLKTEPLEIEGAGDFLKALYATELSQDQDCSQADKILNSISEVPPLILNSGDRNE